MIPDRALRQRRQRRWDRISWWYSLLLVFPVIGLAATIAMSAGANERSGLTGVVKDAYTGKPVSNALVSSAKATARTGSNGSFSVDDLGATSLRVEGTNYEGATVTVIDPSQKLQIALRPTTLSGVVKNKTTNKPIAGVTVTVTGQNDVSQSTVTDDQGRYELTQVPPDATITVIYNGYTVETKPVGQNVEIDFQVRPDVLTGRVTDDKGQPIEGATVAVGTATTTTGADGAYRLGNVPGNGQVTVSKAGYDKVTANVPDSLTFDASLKIKLIKSLYVTAATASSDASWAALLNTVDTTEINSIVLDLKDSSGNVFFDTKTPLATEIGAKNVKYDLAARLKDLRDRNIYAIARIVVFEDPILATAKPELAIRDASTGGPWQTWNGLAWVNPHQRPVWQYNIDLAAEAAKAGFDEIQLDYIRFPTDGIVGNMDFGPEFANEPMQDAIAGFLTQMRDTLAPTGAYLGVTVFGLTMWDEGDGGVGQNLKLIAPLVDVISPMIYPSSFAPGELGLDLPNNYPYEVVLWSLQNGAERLGIPSSKLRPWLQDFSYGDGIPYTATEVAQQIKAANEAGAGGWMLWNVGNVYQVGALAPQ